MTLTPPGVTQEEVEAALTSFARPAMSGPVTLVAGTATTTLTPDRFGAALSMAPAADGGLTPVIDKVKLGALVTEALGGVLPRRRTPGSSSRTTRPRCCRRSTAWVSTRRPRRPGHHGADRSGPDRPVEHDHVHALAHDGGRSGPRA